MRKHFSLSLLVALLIISCHKAPVQKEDSYNPTVLERSYSDEIYYLVGGLSGIQPCSMGNSMCALDGGLDPVLVKDINSGIQLLETEYPNLVLAKLEVLDTQNAIIEMIAAGQEYEFLNAEGEELVVYNGTMIFPNEVAQLLGLSYLEVVANTYPITDKTNPNFWNGRVSVQILTE